MKNVLVVDDEQDIALLLTGILKSAGYKVRFACSAESAQRQIAEDKYEKVFLDVNLGEKNGLSLIPDIVQRNPGCEVIVITAQSELEITQTAKAAGVNKFIFKPFSKTDVISAV